MDVALVAGGVGSIADLFGERFLAVFSLWEGNFESSLVALHLPEWTERVIVQLEQLLEAASKGLDGLFYSLQVL